LELYPIPESKKTKMLRKLAMFWDGQWFLHSVERFGLEEGIALNGSGNLDLDLKVIQIAGTVTVNGQTMPSSPNDRGRLEFEDQEEKNKAVIEGYRLPFPTPESRISILAFPRNIPLKPGDLNWDRMARLEAGLGRLTFPCRLLWGAEDIVFPPANADKFHDLIPKCSSPRMIAHGRHFIQEDAPQEIAEEILTLVNQV